MAQNRIPYFKAWLIFVLVSFVLAFFAGMAVGFVLGAAMGIAGVPIETIQTICGIAGLILGLVVSFVIFRWVVDKFILPAAIQPAASTP